MPAKLGKPTETKVENINEIEVTKPKNKKQKKNINTNIPTETNNSNDNKSKAVKVESVEITNTPVSESVSKPNKKKAKKNKAPVAENDEENGVVAKKAKKTEPAEISVDTSNYVISDDVYAKYPVLKDEELIQKFTAVKVSNNQKGRLRQTLRHKLKDTTGSMLPDVINNMLKESLAMEDQPLRKIRILYNMLKHAVSDKTVVKEKVKKPKKAKKAKKENGTEIEKPEKKEKKENGTEEKKPEQKVKGPKRYVVFIGNLPLDISKEQILQHFSAISDNVKDVRIPKPLENRKSAIAYLEVADEITYELALSRHHSMLENRRINVMYSTQQNSKITKTEAKGKAAKLVAMQKSGKLAGSVPLDKKRSARRKKMKLAQKKAQEA